MAADGLKQRLVGGATLLLVAVIAWFWLLSADSPVDPVARESQIPTAPDIKPFEVREPAQPQGIEPPGSARDSTPVAQSDAVPQPQVQKQAQMQAQPPKQTQAREQERPQAVASPAPAPKPAQAAPQKTPPSAAQQAQLAEANTTRSAVAKSNAATASALATAPAQKAAPLKSTAPATKNSGPQQAKQQVAESKPAAETFQLDQHGLPVAWVVQVGLFSTQASADKIKSTLQAKGYKAYTESFKSEKASGTKVFVGPKLSRERADAQKKAIDELLKTNTLVVRFAAN